MKSVTSTVPAAGSPAAEPAGLILRFVDAYPEPTARGVKASSPQRSRKTVRRSRPETPPPAAKPTTDPGGGKILLMHL